MKLLMLLKFLMIIILPFLLFLIVLNIVGFDQTLYENTFSAHQVYKALPDASSLHEKIINFIKGKNDMAPVELTEKEIQHLWDVRNLINISTIILYLLVALFIFLLVLSALTLKMNNLITNFVGKVLIFGGLLTILLFALLFLFINSNFSATFESFHKLFFKQDTYAFDAKAILVNLYPEQLFMELGIRISEWVIITSAIIIILGVFLLLKSKKQK